MRLKQTVYHIWQTVQDGYNLTNWLIFTIGAAAVLTKVFGLSAILAIVFTLFFFYFIGKIYGHTTGKKKVADDSKDLKA